MGQARTPDTPDVAIVVPHTGTVTMRWAIRLVELDIPPFFIVAKSTASIDLAREKTVEDALAGDPEWFLFLDSDVIPPVDVFPRLQRHDEAVVSGLYYVDGDVPHPAVWVLDENDAPSIADPGDDDLFTADAVGLGCLLVHRQVIDDVDRPWFRWTMGYENHPWDLTHQGERPGISEDFFFCHKVKQAGYDVHVDPTAKCLHEKTCLLSDDGTFLESQLSTE